MSHQFITEANDNPSAQPGDFKITMAAGDAISLTDLAALSGIAEDTLLQHLAGIFARRATSEGSPS